VIVMALLMFGIIAAAASNEWTAMAIYSLTAAIWAIHMERR
jgi:hypothetical protein